MLPGELLQTIRRMAREPGQVHVYFHDDSRGDADTHRASLFYGPHEVCALPVGDIPQRSRYEWRCARCHETAPHPWVCHLGAPPSGIERRGLEFVKEPTSQGHEVIGRLQRRGVEAILDIVKSWRDPDTGQPMTRGAA